MIARCAGRRVVLYEGCLRGAVVVTEEKNSKKLVVFQETGIGHVRIEHATTILRSTVRGCHTPSVEAADSMVPQRRSALSHQVWKGQSRRRWLLRVYAT